MNYPVHNSFAQHTGYKSLAAHCMQAAFILALVCALKSTAPAATKDELCFRGGLRNSTSQPLSASQLQTLLESLRHKTGLAEMRFDENGFLTTDGHTHIEGGSGVARELILSTVHGNRTFEMERHDGSPGVAFAQLVPMEYKEGNQIRHRVGLIQIDFADFTRLEGSPEVLDAFDPGIAVIHELVHGILGLRDAVGSKTQLGECDEYVNRIRRELDLPERQHYSPQVTQLTLAKRVLLAQVSFVRTSDRRRFHLMWEVGSVSANSVATLYGNRAVAASVR